MTCAEALRKLMDAHGLSQRQVGRQGTVSHILRGNVKVQPWFVNAVCDLTGVDQFHRQELHRMAAREQGWEIGE